MERGLVTRQPLLQGLQTSMTTKATEWAINPREIKNE